jgi:2-dehydro-3-deoxyphosphogluconate aldolase / (4S)-4-hydroxy-2-oxoglutarate aldolase
MPHEAAVLGSTPLVAIVRFHEGGPVLDAVDALVRGGIELVEITIDTPGALEAVEAAATAGKTVGVGTILTAEQVRGAAAAGARFVVSPGLIPEVIDVAHELGLEPMPGVFTATETIAAMQAGARVMKLFPASCGGPQYLRVLRGPFPATPLVPTGGVRLDEVSAYLEAGATAVALGSELVGRSAPRSDRELEWIAAQAARAVAEARRVSFDPSGRSIDGPSRPRPVPVPERPAPVETER